MRKVVNFHGIGRPGSGYGDACINIAKAFSLTNIDLNFNLSKFKTIAESAKLKSCDAVGDINFYVGPPPYKNMSEDKYNIIYFYWEADRLPAYWGKFILKADEIWAPCKLVESACRRAGFSKKIRIVPTPYDKLANSKGYTLDIPSEISDKYFVGDNVFKFYSIFQWHHRKGPDILLNSYWKTFGRHDNVILILKVNALNLPGHTIDDIRSDISSIKIKLNLNYYSPVYVIDSTLPKKYIEALHNYSDCYISPHRGEGWGMPIGDAISYKNPVIITKYGGISDYLNQSNSAIIKHRLTHVKNMSWSPNIYNKSQRWAEPSVNSASELMRDVYENFDKYKIKAGRARSIISGFSIDSVSKIISENICQIKL